jgi:hypothetical protein
MVKHALDLLNKSTAKKDDKKDAFKLLNKKIMINQLKVSLTVLGLESQMKKLIKLLITV